MKPTSEDLEQSEKTRIQWVEELLELIGLEPPGRKRDKDTGLASLVQSDGEEDPNFLLHPTHPSPIFALAHPGLPELATTLLAEPALAGKLVDSSDGSRTLRDANDEIHITDTSSIASSTGQGDSMTTYLARQRRTRPELPEEPRLEKLSLADGNEATPPQPPDFNKVPKTLLLPSSVRYSPGWTPLFNFDTYFTELDAARKRVGRKTAVLRDGRPTLGDLLFYAETVTSTQTMLDR